MYQAAALTTTADLLEGKMPTVDDFVSNAALILPLNLATHGESLLKKAGDAKQASQLDLYAKDGTTPEVMGRDKRTAQPTVKPDLPEGLRPAIQHAEGVTEGNAGESHDDVAERVIGKKPVTMEQLEAEPTTRPVRFWITPTSTTKRSSTGRGNSERGD